MASARYRIKALIPSNFLSDSLTLFHITVTLNYLRGYTFKKN